MNFEVAKKNMLKQQLRTGNVLDENIIALYDEIPRHEFVPEKYRNFAYTDQQIELPHQQRMMTPLEEGLLLQALDLKGHETVLEVGTGSGFLTALLSRLCTQVISIDYYESFSTAAHKNLDTFDCNNVTLKTGDASQGWFEQAPYDVIILAGGLEAIDTSHQLQVIPGGKLFAIIGKNPVMEGQLHTLNENGAWSHQLVFKTCLPSLINKLASDEFIF